jgi:hypothetical protein
MNCDCPDCPGPRLVARLEAAEAIVKALGAFDRWREGWLPGVGDVLSVTVTTEEMRALRTALSAYESASEPVKERT